MSSFELESLKNALLASENTLALEAQAIQNALQNFKKDSTPYSNALKIMNETLNKKGKIICSGIGKSGKIGEKISSTLTSTGSLSVFLHPTEAMHGDFGIVREEDCVIALSYTGNTDEIMKLIPTLKSKKIPLIAICGKKDSLLAEAATVLLLADVEKEACPHNLAPTTSTTLTLAIGDALAIGLMKLRNFNENLFALNHPGGSLGRKLTLTVSDVLHSMEKCAVVSALDFMGDVVLKSTEAKLGAALVVNPHDQTLEGIITDGDLRRALSHKEKFFSMTAKEVMTSTPKTISSEQLAVDALKFMRDGSAQISVLPVVHFETKTLMGLVRLHDLLKIF